MSEKSKSKKEEKSKQPPRNPPEKSDKSDKGEKKKKSEKGTPKGSDKKSRKSSKHDSPSAGNPFFISQLPNSKSMLAGANQTCFQTRDPPLLMLELSIKVGVSQGWGHIKEIHINQSLSFNGQSKMKSKSNVSSTIRLSATSATLARSSSATTAQSWAPTTPNSTELAPSRRPSGFAST